MSTNNNLSDSATAEHRVEDRAQVTLKTVVQVTEATGEVWKEIAEVKSVSRNGAGFCLSRPCGVGRLVKMVMPLDPKLRAYDELKDVYPVMGIIQYCNAATVAGEKVYHVGVGFVGKNVPESYKVDPAQNYRIGGMTKDGLWRVVEAESQFKNRKDPRYWLSLGVSLSLINRTDRSVIKEDTFTRNISASGLSLASRLDASVGDKVKVACKEMDFYAVAVVRNRSARKEDDATLHVEFVESQFPIDKLIAARTVNVADTR